MKGKVIRLIFLILEIASNAICMVILPQPYKFKIDYLLKSYKDLSEEDISYLEENLKTPKETSSAIFVFGGIMCFIEFLKVISFFFFCKKRRNIKYAQISAGLDYFGFPALFITWCMAISIIPKLNEINSNGISNKITDGIKKHIIFIIILYSFSYIFILCQYFLKQILKKFDCYKCGCDCDCDCCDCCVCCDCCCTCCICCGCKRNDNPSEIKNDSGAAVKINNVNSNQNLTSERKNIFNFFGNGNNRVPNNRVSNTINTSNNIVLFSNILPQQIYNNIRSFIEQGKAKMIALLKFYLDMKFDGLTTHESISTEIATIICVVGKVLSDEYGDRIAKACLESGSEDHVMLLLHYAFPYVVEVIKLKIEKGIYKRSLNITNINMIQTLTSIERTIEQDEQGNIKISFRINKQINQASLMGILNQ